MKFAHLADCHIGSWREPELRELSLESFKEAIDMCIREHIGFVIIAGDLFDTSLPSIDIIKDTASILKRLKEEDISCYIIPGSHDFSPSGKTMLEVLEHAGLVENVMKFEDNKLIFTEDKTGVKLTGMYGKKGSLEKETYENLEREHLEKENGFKIFIFHSLLEELKPKNMIGDSYSLTLLPKNFNYYAGGHPHITTYKSYNDHGIIAYPGPIFPNNFKELEELKHGNFYIVEVNDRVNLKEVPIKLKEVNYYRLDANNKTPYEVQEEIKKINETDGIILLRIEGILKEGNPSDIKFPQIKSYCFLKNTSKLLTKEIEEINITDATTIEADIIKECNKGNLFDNELVLEFMDLLNKEKNEGERNMDFEDRIIKDIKSILGIEV